MMCRIFRLIAITVTMAGLLALPSVYAGTNIASTVHNLTPTGPGNFKAPEATGLCVFLSYATQCFAPGPVVESRTIGRNVRTLYQQHTDGTGKTAHGQFPFVFVMSRWHAGYGNLGDANRWQVPTDLGDANG